jgi:tRNA(Arg) A34 adenosine deaminase TadA
MGDLAPPMRRALELAWEAFRNGSFPVGAVIVGPDGATVAEGRNRIGETDAPPGRMRNTGLAHAEMDALAQLPLGEYPAHTLYTSLEPCLLCRAAITMAHVGEVRYLAADAICDGLDGMATLTGHAAMRYPTIHRETDSIAARFASVLPIAVVMAFNEHGFSAAHYRACAPTDAHAAATIVRERRWPSRDHDLDAAIDYLTPLLAW